MLAWVQRGRLVALLLLLLTPGLGGWAVQALHPCPAAAVGHHHGAGGHGDNSGVVSLAGGRALAAFDAAAVGRRGIGVTELDADGQVAGHSMLPDSDGGAYPQLAMASARAAVVAYTARSGERQELRLARVALPEADH